MNSVWKVNEGVFNHHSNRLLEYLLIGKKHGVSFFPHNMSGKNTEGVGRSEGLCEGK